MSDDRGHRVSRCLTLRKPMRSKPMPSMPIPDRPLMARTAVGDACGMVVANVPGGIEDSTRVVKTEPSTAICAASHASSGVVN